MSLITVMKRPNDVKKKQISDDDVIELWLSIVEEGVSNEDEGDCYINEQPTVWGSVRCNVAECIYQIGNFFFIIGNKMINFSNWIMD